MARFATTQLSIVDAANTLADKIDSSQTIVVTALATASPTLTAAQMVNGIISLSGQSAAQTITTATATALVALIPDAQIGYGFDLTIANGNTSSGTAALGAGTGVTLAITGTAAQPVATTRRYCAVITNVATPAITIYAIGQVA